MTKAIRPLLALAATALLAACSSDTPPPPPTDNGVEMLDVTNEALNVQEAPATMNVPEPATQNVAEELPPVPDREQIQADADATGMTARVDRDAEDAPAATTNSTVSEEK
ncbi:MAG: hypothetical protein V4537_12345 [Pseudomonadota bacterium]